MQIEVEYFLFFYCIHEIQKINVILMRIDNNPTFSLSSGFLFDLFFRVIILFLFCISFQDFIFISLVLPLFPSNGFNPQRSLVF